MHKISHHETNIWYVLVKCHSHSVLIFASIPLFQNSPRTISRYNKQWKYLWEQLITYLITRDRKISFPSWSMVVLSLMKLPFLVGVQNLQWLICHVTKPNHIYLIYMYKEDLAINSWLFSVFWPFSIILSFGWSPLGRQLPNLPGPLIIL